MSSKITTPSGQGQVSGLPLVLLVLVVVFLALFHDGFPAGHTLFSNDGPLGTQVSESHRMPEGFTGGWQDLNSLGFRELGGIPNVTYLMLWLLGPVGYSKLNAPIALLILGLGAWCFFRQQRLAPAACILGGLAAALNSGFFSAACWGVAIHAITIGMSYFAMAALSNTAPKWRWLRVAAAGVAIGLAVSEGSDIGAIFSLFVAGFAMYQAWLGSGSWIKHLGLGAVRVAVVAVVAGFVAAQAITILVGTQIQGVASMKQDPQTKAARWDEATQWSLPKKEALGLVIPGLFGYRMDTQGGGAYWGGVGRTPVLDRWFDSGKSGPQPGGMMRFSGGGIYAGVLVVLVALWAALQGFRKKDSVFSDERRRWIWFWSAIAIASLLFAFGRFAPFYQILYALPYFSTIRNPAKFVRVLNWALVVLFAYGVHGLWDRYLAPARAVVDLKSWWQRVTGFERRWVLGCALAIGASALCWLIFASSRAGFETYLQDVQFDPATAKSIAGFSIRHVGLFIVFLAVAVGLLVLVFSGRFTGPRARWGAVLLGLFLVIDLGRANQPWVVVWDYDQKYATNPVIDFLRQKPYEHRVAVFPRFLIDALRLPPELTLMSDVYSIEWAQHVFLYYNIQSLDLVQMPRMPEDLESFERAFAPKTMGELITLLPRKWQLTNTRYIIGPVALLDFLNQQLDAGRGRFKIAERFQLAPKPGLTQVTRLEDVTAVPATNGNFAVFDFTGALPRAGLYANWQMSTNGDATLQELTTPSFDPAGTVFVSQPLPTAPQGTNQATGTVQVTAYAPKRILFDANAATPAVLLLNDRYDPNWRVFVDGKPETLLKCNFLMRGVYLTPGSHKVEFRFEPPTTSFYVSLVAVLLGVGLCVSLVVLRPEPAGEVTADRNPREPARI